MNNSNNIKAIIWTKSTCPYCIKAKLLLQSNNIPFIEHDLLKGASIDEFKKTFPTANSVPQIYFKTKLGNEYIGGYDDLSKHLSTEHKNNLFYINLNKISRKKSRSPSKKSHKFKGGKNIKRKSHARKSYKFKGGKTIKRKYDDDFPDAYYTDNLYEDNQLDLPHLRKWEDDYTEDYEGSGDIVDGSPTIEGYDYSTFRWKARRPFSYAKYKKLIRSKKSKKFKRKQKK